MDRSEAGVSSGDNSAAEPIAAWDMARASLGEIFRMPRLGRRGLVAFLALAAIAWAATAFYRVQPDEKGVVLRFGQWVGTAEPGMHVHWPWPIETVLLPKVTQVNQIQLTVGASSAADPQSNRGGQMLTGDENIVEADSTVFWKIRDPGEYLFRVDNLEQAVEIAAKGALRDVISRTPIQGAMSNRREQIAEQTKTLLQTLLDEEKAGVEIVGVQLQRVEPPLAVIDAFNDVQRARADQERARNEAQAYANDIVPRARGEAERIRQDSEAYKAQVVNLAHGEADGFLPLLRSYEQAKDVTAWRLYLESIDEVLRRASKVIVDTSGKGVSSVMPYLPVTEFKPQAPAAPPAAPVTPAPAPGPAK